MPDKLRQSPQPDVPTYDYLEQRNLDEYGDLEWLLEDLIQDIEEGYFLRWEIVIRQEQGQKLTRRQRKLLKKLIYFGDDPDDRILYIDGIARPSEPWYEIVRKVASKLLLKKFETFEVHYAAATEGWPRLVECLEKYGSGLSLPEGAKSPVDIVPEHTRHQLWLQACFDALSGLGQDDILTLEDNDQHTLSYRVVY
ncbi:MAG: hypothetical protein JW936_02200 [Sedimentisphaerales bacterium]|nr:hypothetical protein [Sedimentisphaerales bacterium]